MRQPAPAAVTCTVPERGVELTTSVGAGRTLGVVGPNGAGKSTLLGVLAGTVAARHGHVSVGEDVLVDTERGVHVPPHRRGVGLLAQEPLLFPHLRVLDNVAFGLQATGLTRSAARRRAHDVLASLSAESWADRWPRELSGGQAARVALARAVAPEPRVLLLDEPLAAVDAESVPALRTVLRETLADRTAILVTHDPLDALLLADDVTVIEDGHVSESGPAHQVLTAPRSTFAARLAGLNLLRGEVCAEGLRTADALLVHADIGTLAVGTRAVAVVDPGAVAVHLDHPHGSPRNVWPTHISAIEPRGRHLVVRTPVADAEVTAAAVAELDLRPGLAVHLAVKATEVALHQA